MALKTARRLVAPVALVCCGTFALGAQVPAQAAVTFTHITTPSGHRAVLVDGTSPQLTIAGTASSDLDRVDVYCVRGDSQAYETKLLAPAVPVTAGTFSVTTTVPALGAVGPVCRLQALPQTTQPSPGGTTPFTGPVLYVDTVTRTSVGDTTVDFRLTAGGGVGQMTAGSAAKCGSGSLAPLLPGLRAATGSAGCVGNLGGTAGSVRVGGHPALLPSAVSAFTSATTPLTVRFHLAKSGDLTWTESAVLMRCQGTDTYPPPTPGQCGAVVSTGVRFERQATYDASRDQVRLRDSFASVDGARHRVAVSYGMESTPPGTGGLGFAFPGTTGGFRSVRTSQVVTGLPHRAATILVRSNRYSSEGDPQASTRAITYSRAPSRLMVAPSDATAFAMRYALTVSRSATARLGFTDSEAIRTTAARALGRVAAREMMPLPRITSPARGAVISGSRTVVTGVVTAGANGLPNSVRVNGKAAALTVHGATRATFRAVLDEPPGRHTIRAVARDAGGNTRSTSITVRNT